MKHKIKGACDVATSVNNQIDCIDDINALCDLRNKLNTRINEVTESKNKEIYNHSSIKYLMKLVSELYKNNVADINVTCKCNITLESLNGDVRVADIYLADNPEHCYDMTIDKCTPLKNNKQFIKFSKKYQELYQNLLREIERVSQDLGIDEDEIKERLSIEHM